MLLPVYRHYIDGSIFIVAGVDVMIAAKGPGIWTLSSMPFPLWLLSIGFSSG